MFKIRQGHPEDADLLSDLAFRAKAHWGYDADFMEACRGEMTYHETDFPSYYFAVAENPQVVGFYSLGFLTELETELNALFVDPDQLGKGYGRALLNHAKIQARVFDAKSIIIISDPHAVEFYKANGAQLCGERPSESIPDRMLPLLSLPLNR
ncbi:MAG: GNAT family N-acetyltransferase [Cellvibrionaceae bacterium]